MVLPTLKLDEMNMNNPGVIKVMNTMDVISLWTKIHFNVFERYE